MAARTEMPLETRIEIAAQMLSPDRGWGVASAVAQQHGVSRATVYYLTDKAAALLATGLQPSSGPTPVAAVVTVTASRLQRAVALLSYLGVSQRDTTLALAELLDTHRSPGYVAQVLQAAEALAAARNAELQPALSGLLAADEIFLHAQPILGVVHPASLYLVGLSLAPQRDGTTWGCQFLDLPESAGVISDAGSGLAAGAALARVACHAGDWMHPLLQTGWVDAQYERQAYAALAAQYAREAQLRRTTTPKRWANHWAKYLTACAVADQAIARYDHWHALRCQLRAAAAQFDWATGQVRTPAQVQAELQALHTAFAQWAVGTQAQALVRALGQQTEALTTALPQLQAALAPLAAAWGDEATRQVCRLWQALQDWAFPSWRPAQRQQLEQAIAESLAWASAHLGQRLPTLQHLVAAILAQWPRTSSAVECLNSLLRPFLNGRKQVSQGFLELFRFFHNTHVFQRGPRAGHSPLALAGGPHIEDPLAYLGLGQKA